MKNRPPKRDDTVLLAHGFLSSPRSMRRLSAAFSARGYRVHCWSYPNTLASLVAQGEKLLGDAEQLLRTYDSGRLHFVGHSMGGIACRIALQRLKDRFERSRRRLGRLVLIATPNRGSRLTRIPLGPLARWAPSLVEVSVRSGSFVNQLADPVETEVGVIVASRDSIISRRSASLATASDAAVVDASHHGVLRSPETLGHALSFVATGRMIGSRTPLAPRSIAAPIRAHAQAA